MVENASLKNQLRELQGKLAFKKSQDLYLNIKDEAFDADDRNHINDINILDEAFEAGNKNHTDGDINNAINSSVTTNMRLVIRITQMET